jgi:hypothetical protein
VFDHNTTKNDMIMNNLLLQHYFTRIVVVKTSTYFTNKQTLVYYIQVWLFLQRTRISDNNLNGLCYILNCILGWWRQININNILIHFPLKKSTSWKNKLRFTLNLLLELAAEPGTFPFFLSINIWRQFRT